MNNAITEATTDHARAKRYWIADNTGILGRIAREVGVSQPFVSDVFHRRRNSTDGRVEQKLAEAGAPGFQSSAVLNPGEN